MRTAMKTRWMASVIDASKDQTPPPPFHRGQRRVRKPRRAARSQTLRKSA